MGTLVLVADRETTHGAQQALDVLASFRRAPVYPVVGKRPVTLLQLEGGVYKRRPGAIKYAECSCGRADCAADELADIWAVLDQTALGYVGDIQIWLAHRAYQITRDACMNGEHVDFELPDLTEHAAVCS
jgi:hypothetical protein